MKKQVNAEEGAKAAHTKRGFVKKRPTTNQLAKFEAKCDGFKGFIFH
jgi:hypothetical protein